MVANLHIRGCVIYEKGWNVKYMLLYLNMGKYGCYISQEEVLECIYELILTKTYLQNYYQ